ncbi:unnamed protein product [Prunus armeniaca]|uniref:Uncharacterized protein n=1 Tax=Prunus armeniaca TaxID=36596 RepID=A0A6J5Y5J2_PRUAR|nr:unnamed protein product [Prunus armeniaca]
MERVFQSLTSNPSQSGRHTGWFSNDVVKRIEYLIFQGCRFNLPAIGSRSNSHSSSSISFGVEQLSDTMRHGLSISEYNNVHKFNKGPSISLGFEDLFKTQML